MLPLLCITICTTVGKLSGYIYRQLKHHENRIKREFGISLEIILNVFNGLTASLVQLKSLLLQYRQFCLFQLAYSMNLVCSQMCTFFCPLWKRRFSLLPAGTHIHIWQHIQQKDSTFCLPLHSYALAIHLKNEVLR